MKKCGYCGRLNEDAGGTCGECGSSDFSTRSDSGSAAEPSKLDPDQIPLAAMAQKDGTAVTLRCRTRGEAYLICDELEEADVLPILPEEEESLAQFRRNGLVEVRVSAKAYESLAGLKSTVEFPKPNPQAAADAASAFSLYRIRQNAAPFSSCLFLLTAQGSRGAEGETRVSSRSAAFCRTAATIRTASSPVWGVGLTVVVRAGC